MSEEREKIVGVNLGNWLVLEKWMQPFLFEENCAEDEVWLNRKVPAKKLRPLMKKHRDTYIEEADFAKIAAHGINAVRLPVPYFVFGDRKPYSGCIEYVDQAMDYAEKYGLKVLIDLHTVPGGQNSYDNGGITGVCKWHRNPKEIAYVLYVLERLGKRYGHRKGLLGIEVLNEPISFRVYLFAPSRKQALDQGEAIGSSHVPMRFLKTFYKEAYETLRAVMAPEKLIVFHDGFRLSRWKDFFVKNGMKNVLLDVHVYLWVLDSFLHFHNLLPYQLLLRFYERQIRRAGRYTPVLVGEWCLCNRVADRYGKSSYEKDEAWRKKVYRRVARMQLKTWDDCNAAGSFYWNYQLYRDRQEPMYTTSLDSWDLCRCWSHGWMPKNMR